MTRPHTLIPDDKADTYKAAYLATMGHTQEDIGYMLGMAQATVHRKLSEAREMKLIGKSRPPWTGTEGAEREVAELLSPLDELSDRFAALSERPGRLLEVRILENAHHPGETEHHEFARRTAAYLLGGLLRANDKIGCAWAGCSSAWLRRSRSSTIARARNGVTSPSCQSAATPPKSSGRRCAVPQTSRPISIVHSPAEPIPNTPSVASSAAFRASSTARAPRRSEISSRRFRATAKSSESIRSPRARHRSGRAEGAGPHRCAKRG